MYRKIKDFLHDWEIEKDLTLKIFSAVHNEILLEKVSNNVRTLGKIAWHITQTLTEMPHKTGVYNEDYLENKPVPNTIEEIIGTYRDFSSKLIEKIKNEWTDEDLTNEIDIYGQKWIKSKVLSVLILHQVHHRAQMTVVMRMLGIKVPGIYGPAKEEWAEYGMSPQD